MGGISSGLGGVTGNTTKPGCVATGGTREEEQQIREAIEFHIEGWRECGEPIPEPTSVADAVEVIAG